MKNNLQLKHCNKCDTTKEITEFHKHKNSKDGFYSVCKSCVKEYKRLNKEKIAKYMLEYNKKYQSENYERLRQQRLDYKAKNKEYLKQKNKEWYENNKEEIRKKKAIYKKKYMKTEAGKASHINYKHRRREKEKQGDVTNEQLIELRKSKKCYWCGVSINKNNIHIDHYIPLGKGGKHTISNLVASCSDCNLKKSAKDPLEFANSVGKLF